MSSACATNAQEAKNSPIDPQLLIAPDLPAGYFTVPSWWVLRERGAFALLDDPLATLAEEEARVYRYCVEAGSVPLWVSASPHAASLGRAEERAYSATLLTGFYPPNP